MSQLSLYEVDGPEGWCGYLTENESRAQRQYLGWPKSRVVLWLRMRAELRGYLFSKVRESERMCSSPIYRVSIEGVAGHGPWA